MVLVIPRLLRSNVASIITARVVLIVFPVSPLLRILEVPEHMVLNPLTQDVWIPYYHDCISLSGVKFCPSSSMYKKRSLCIRDIFYKNGSSSCGLNEPKGTSMAQQYSKGTLISTTLGNISKVYRNSDGFIGYQLIQLNQGKSVYLPSHEYKEILVDGKIYSYNTVPFEVFDNQQWYSTIHVKFDINSELPDIPIVDKIEYIHEQLIITETVTFSTAVVVIIIIIVVIPVLVAIKRSKTFLSSLETRITERFPLVATLTRGIRRMSAINIPNNLSVENNV